MRNTISCSSTAFGTFYPAHPVETPGYLAQMPTFAVRVRSNGFRNMCLGILVGCHVRGRRGAGMRRGHSERLCAELGAAGTRLHAAGLAAGTAGTPAARAGNPRQAVPVRVTSLSLSVPVGSYFGTCLELAGMKKLCTK